MHDKVIFIVEEVPMEATLRNLMPKLIGDIECEIHPYKGRRDLM